MSQAQTAPPVLSTYTFVDLGATLGQTVPTLAGNTSAARGINDSRVIVGDNGIHSMYGAAQGSVAWRHANGSGTSAIINGSALAVNSAGVVAGTRWLNATRKQPVRVLNGVVEPLTTVTSGPDGIPNTADDMTNNYDAIAFGISDTGYIVGSLTNTSNSNLLLPNGAVNPNFGIEFSQAFRWINGQTVYIGESNGYTEAFGVNNAGDVVGAMVRPGQNDGTAFLWRNNMLTFLTTPNSRADDINNNNLIVGTTSVASGGSVAFKHLNSTHTPLGTLPGFSRHGARAVNDAGLIVGEAYNDSGEGVAVIWINDQPRNLNTIVALPLGWTLVSAAAVNSNGDIVGSARFGTEQRGFLLQAGALSQPANPGRLVNLSVLTSVASANDGFSLGFFVGGTATEGTKPLVVRAVGPSLLPFGVSDGLQDPKIELYVGTSKTGENDNWGGTTLLTNGMASVGAFPLATAASRDSVAIASVPKGENSVQVSATGTGLGTVLAEIYDATPSANFTTTTPRLVNVSVRKNIGSSLTVGFVIAGSTAKSVLIRGIGPGLARPPFNVTGVVTDPELVLYSGSTRIDGNNNWGGTAPRDAGPDGLIGTPDDTPNAVDIALSATFARVGAFPLLLGSRDAALVTTLAPGNYSVTVSGLGGTTGVAVLEIYEVP